MEKRLKLYKIDKIRTNKESAKKCQLSKMRRNPDKVAAERKNKSLLENSHNVGYKTS